VAKPAKGLPSKAFRIAGVANCEGMDDGGGGGSRTRHNLNRPADSKDFSAQQELKNNKVCSVLRRSCGEQFLPQKSRDGQSPFTARQRACKRKGGAS